MNFMHHYEISIPRTRPYVMAGLGATTYHANGNGISDAVVLLLIHWWRHKVLSE